MLTVRQAAERLKVPQHRIRYAIRTGKIKATRYDWFYLIKEEDLPDKMPSRRERGMNEDTDKRMG